MNTNTIKRCENCGSGYEGKRHWRCPVCGDNIKLTADQFFARAMDAQNDFRNLLVKEYRRKSKPC